MSCCKLFSNMSWINFQNIWELLSSHKQRFLDKGKSNSWQSYAKKMFLKFLKNILLWNVLKINIAIKSKHQISYENSDVPSQLPSQLFWGNSCTCTGYILCAQVQSQCGNTAWTPDCRHRARYWTQGIFSVQPPPLWWQKLVESASRRTARSLYWA